MKRETETSPNTVDFIPFSVIHAEYYYGYKRYEQHIFHILDLISSYQTLNPATAAYTVTLGTYHRPSGPEIQSKSQQFS